MTDGGLGPARPDQHYEPPAGGQAAPGARAVVRARTVIVVGTGPNVGLFAYSPTAAHNHLVASITAGPGTDPYGNAYLAGVTAYSLTMAAQLVAGELTFWAAPSQSGPWTSGPQVFSSGAGGNLELTGQNPASQVVIPFHLLSALAGLAVTGGVTADTETINPNAANTIGLTVSNSVSNAGNALVEIINALSTDRALIVKAAADSNARLRVDTTGQLNWGSGAAGTDTTLARDPAGGLDLTGGLTADTETVTGIFNANGTAAISGSQANNQILTVTNLVSDTAALVLLTIAAAGNGFLAMQVAGDTNNRFTIGGATSTRLAWGPGNAAIDTFLDRIAAHTLAVTSADLAVDSVGRGLQVKEGSNAKMGIATLASGVVAVSTTAVTANSRIFITAQDNNTTGALRVTAITAGSGFNIFSTVGTDHGVVAWLIMEPAP